MPLLIQNSAGSLLVQLEGTDGLPISGLTFADLTADLVKEGGSFVAFTLTALNFIEIGSGTYQILLAAVDTDTLGNLYLRLVGGTIKSSLVDALVAVSAPTAPTTTPDLVTSTLFGFLKNAIGAPLSGVSVSYRILSTPAIFDNGTDSVLVSGSLVTTTSDAFGFFTLTAISGSVIEVFIPVANYRRSVTVPSGSSNLFEIV